MVVPLYHVAVEPGVGSRVEKVLQTGRLAAGEYVLEFEDKLRSFVGNPLVLATGEMSGSLTMCLYLAGVRPGDEVIASPLACVAANAPVGNLFAKIRWCDCDPRSGSIDPESLVRLINGKTKAILVSHWAGNPVDLKPVYEIAKASGVSVVEDASEAFGAMYEGSRIGNTGGDFVVFSFYPNRHMTTIEGAAIACRDPRIFEQCRWLRRYGIHQPTFRLSDGEINPESDICDAGWNCYMNQVAATVGIAQFASMEDRLARWQDNGRFYDDALRQISGVDVLSRPDRSASAYWVYTFLCDERDRLQRYLAERGIQASKVHVRNDIYSCFGQQNCDLPGVTAFSKRSISIPCGWWVSESQREQIVEQILGFH
ncbi:MAG: aminotransferase class V-fold PLP-dependent enzyme [Planctomycetaceae bacterium]|nr:aminotransferase class V-fold PLP-dependent enzyme [Planctomycetaceae bacterium]